MDEEEEEHHYLPKRKRTSSPMEERQIKKMVASLMEGDWIVVRSEEVNEDHIWEGPYQVVLKTSTYVCMFDKEHRFIDALIEDVRKIMQLELVNAHSNKWNALLYIVTRRK
jgi:hypothetical protein